MVLIFKLMGMKVQTKIFLTLCMWRVSFSVLFKCFCSSHGTWKPLLSLTFIVKDSTKNKWTIQVQLLRCFGSATQGTRPFQDHRSTAVVAGLGQLGLKKIDKIIKYHNSKQDKYCSVCPTKYTQLRESWERELRES